MLDLATLTKAGLLFAFMAPLTIDNLRTGRIGNTYNTSLFAAGLFWLGLSHALGWSQDSLLIKAMWIVGEVVALFLIGFWRLRVPGGVVKSAMALTPWFSPAALAAICFASLILIIVSCKATGRKEWLGGPPLLLTSLAATFL